jgi:hypothetical protein
VPAAYVTLYLMSANVVWEDIFYEKHKRSDERYKMSINFNTALLRNLSKIFTVLKETKYINIWYFKVKSGLE